METAVIKQLKARNVVTSGDVDRVAKVIEQYPDAPFFILIEKLHKFIKDVTPAHYLIAGFLTGHKMGTEKVLSNINNYQLWVKCN